MQMKTYRYLYGPVPSRRLGRSLGIDLVPSKICTYDCIYCQIGKATEKTLLRKEYIPKEEVLEEKVLSLIVEFLVPSSRIAEIMERLKDVSKKINTVFSLCAISRLEEDGSNPNLDALTKLGYSAYPNAKVNIGLGWACSTED